MSMAQIQRVTIMAIRIYSWKGSTSIITKLQVQRSNVVYLVKSHGYKVILSVNVFSFNQTPFSIYEQRCDDGINTNSTGHGLTRCRSVVLGTPFKTFYRKCLYHLCESQYVASRLVSSQMILNSQHVSLFRTSQRKRLYRISQQD